MDEKYFFGIYTRLRHYTKANSDADIARSLDVTPQSFSTFKKQSKIPPDLLIRYCLINNISIDWLLTGEAKGCQEDNRTRLPYGYRREIPYDEIDKVRMQRYLDCCWKNADEEERTWLKVQFRKAFPEYIAWLEEHKYDAPEELRVEEPQRRYGSSIPLPDFELNETQAPYKAKKDDK
ncbi:MAG: helix-turn-helix domain containing protein [Candidatus Magnetominusculus sp. LBB02]|nr:helix-turn-helix domain containing protein [Candidatus Magnetominusculus sp. LBB02]